MFPGTNRSSAGVNSGSSRLNAGRGTSGKISLKTPKPTHGEPSIESPNRTTLLVLASLSLL